MPNRKNPNLHLDEIINCLGRIAQILHDKPHDALRELREISALIDSQIPYRDGHTQRVNKYSLEIGKRLGFSEKQMVNLEAAALLHDFGKIGIDESILLKPAALTKAERLEVELHVLRGYYILQGFAELADALEGVKSHHEHFDGSGYPDGLSKQSIPLLGRIIAVADAFDAMTSERPYRKARTKDDAIKELEKYTEKHFDPEIIRIFIDILDSRA